MKPVTESVSSISSNLRQHPSRDSSSCLISQFSISYLSSSSCILLLLTIFRYYSYSAAWVIENWIDLAMFCELCGLVFKDLLTLSPPELSDLSQLVHSAIVGPGKPLVAMNWAYSYLSIYHSWVSGLLSSLGHIFHCSVLTSNLAAVLARLTQ